MANRLERVPELTVIPGTPAQPAVPERCVNVQVGTRLVAREVTQTSVQSPSFSEFQVVDNVDGEVVPNYSGIEQVVTGPPNTSFDDPGASDTVTVYETVPIYEQQCFGGDPFVPGTPTRIVEDAGPDWLSYARSQPVVPESGGFDVDIVGPLIIGLMAPVVDGGYSLGVVDYGLYYDGVEVFPVIGGVVGASLGAHTGTLAVKVERQLGVHKAFIAGTEVHTANITQSDTAALVAFLETDTGYAENPAKFIYTITTGSAAGTLPVTATAVDALGVTPLGTFGQTAHGGALVDGQLDVLATGTLSLVGHTAPTLDTSATVTGLLGQSAALTTAEAEGGQIRGTPMTMFASDAPYASIKLAVPKQQLTAVSVGSAPNIAITRGVLGTSKPVFSAYMVTGGLIASALTVPKQSMFASEGPFAQITGSIPKQSTIAFMTAGELQAVHYTEAVVLFAGNTPTRLAAVSLTLGELGLSDDLVLSLAVTEQLEAALSLTDDYSLSRMLQVLVENKVQLTATARAPEQIDTQYLVTELSGALSRATGMQFDQFVYSGGRTYGVRKDGMYLIGAVEEMNAEADFGATTMGTSRAKNLETAYIGLTTDGTVYLVAEADGKEKVYKAIQREPTMRVRTGKGITGRSWHLKLKLLDATRVDLEDLELVVGVTRRWTR